MALELRGRESQCPLCNRTFSSDPMCEKHKSYPGGNAQCVDPETLGMVRRPASSNRGFEIWTLPIPEELQWWKQNGPVERVPAGPQVLTCDSCGIVWERKAQRGRKPKRCEKCRMEAAV